MGDRALEKSGLCLTAPHDCQPTAQQNVRAWPLLVAAALALVLGLGTQRRFFHDDAYIPLRYAERMLAGEGLTWNKGEHVEGFSSPLWLAQLVLLGGLGVPLPVAARGLGVAYALAIFALWWRAKARPEGLWALVTIPGFPLWAVGGLETIAACFWMLLAMAWISRGPSRGATIRSGLFLALSLAAVALSRPEGVAVACALLGSAWPGRSRRSLLFGAGGFLAAFAAYQIYRLVYFGDFIANGARAKTLGLPLGARLEDAAIYVGKTAPQWLGAVLLALWMLAWSPKRGPALRLLLPVFPLLLAVALAGGDHMLGSRLMLAPAAALCLAGSLAPPPARPWVRRSTLLLAMLCGFWQIDLTWKNPAAPNPAAAVGELVGRALEARLAPGTLVATATAGSVPYFAPSLAFIDTLGLNDQHVARQTPAAMPAAVEVSDAWLAVPGHQRGDGAYVLARAPDAIMLGGANGDLLPWFLGDYQVVMSALFRAAYAPWRILVPVPVSSRPWLADEIDPESGRLPITLYVRRDSPAWATLAREGKALPAPWAPAR